MTACYSHVIYGPSVDTIVANGLPDTATNVVIPYTGKPKLTIRTVYAEDGIQVKYYEYTVKVSATIYLPVATFADIEYEVARIKKILAKPRQMLKIYPCGLGTTPVVNGIVGNHGTDFLPDVTYGPHPSDLSVVPAVTNEAIDIEWTVVTNITHCSSVYVQSLIQFVTELNIDIDQDGNIGFVQRAIYEASSRIPDLSIFNNTMNSFGRTVGTSFVGMHQTRSTQLSMDGRTATFEAKYTEIPSDSAFHPWIRNVDFTDELSSDLMGGGFYKWQRRFSAKITLPSRIHKAWAWIVFKAIVKERLRNLEQLTKAKAKDFQKPGIQNSDNTAAKNFYLCIKMKFTNPIYTRTMSFDFEYLLTTSLDRLLSKTLICSRVNTGWRPNAATGEPEATDTPVTLSDQWRIWDTQAIHTLTGEAKYKTSVPITYDQCATSSIPIVPMAPIIRAQKLLGQESDPDLDVDVATGSPGESTAGETVTQNMPSELAVDPNYSWIDYKNNFEFIQKNDNIQAAYLQATPNSYYQNLNVNGGPGRGTTGFQLDNQTSRGNESAYTRPETVARGISTFKVRMKGYSIRAGSPTPAPVLTSVGGHAVERTDEARISTSQIAQSDTTPVFLTMWDITYNVSGDIHSSDIMSTVHSTGHPGYYA